MLRGKSSGCGVHAVAPSCKVIVFIWCRCQSNGISVLVFAAAGNRTIWSRGGGNGDGINCESCGYFNILLRGKGSGCGGHAVAPSCEVIVFIWCRCQSNGISVLVFAAAGNRTVWSRGGGNGDGINCESCGYFNILLRGKGSGCGGHAVAPSCEVIVFIWCRCQSNGISVLVFAAAGNRTVWSRGGGNGDGINCESCGYFNILLRGKGSGCGGHAVAPSCEVIVFIWCRCQSNGISVLVFAAAGNRTVWSRGGGNGDGINGKDGAYRGIRAQLVNFVGCFGSDGIPGFIYPIYKMIMPIRNSS